MWGYPKKKMPSKSSKDIPEANIHKISMWKNGTVRVFVRCCYCNKLHNHWPGVKDVKISSKTDFGTRLSHCIPGGEYRLSMALWSDLDSYCSSSNNSSNEEEARVFQEK
jgi:hypothetical protein